MTPEGTTGTAIPFSVGTFMSIAAFTAVAWYNVAELNVQVFLTFKRHRGLYFWSLLISSWGCVLHALGFLLKFFQLTSDNYISVTIITIGWYAMVTGQSVVLYSRLHLVVRDQRILRAILTMIIVDAICFHIPTTVLTYGSNTHDPHRYTRAFNVMEKVQMTAFCIQEFIISGVYVWATINLLRPVYHGRTRKVMTQLIWINLIIIGMDICLLAMEYSNIYDIEATLKAMVYSIKLKLEFAVLNQLMSLANSAVATQQNFNVAISPDPSGEKPRPLAGRSKSTEYISRRYRKPTKRKSSRSKSHTPNKSRPPSSCESGFDAKHDVGYQWVPALDRKATPSFIDVQHIEDAQRQELNIFTNPAACYRPGRAPHGYAPHDGLGGIPDSPILSPTPTGPNLESRSSRTFRNANADLLPFQSSRPSVSDWARDLEGDSFQSDEVRLDPRYSEHTNPIVDDGDSHVPDDGFVPPLQSAASTRTSAAAVAETGRIGRRSERASGKSSRVVSTASQPHPMPRHGMDFMTSALSSTHGS